MPYGVGWCSGRRACCLQICAAARIRATREVALLESGQERGPSSQIRLEPSGLRQVEAVQNKAAKAADHLHRCLLT